MKRKWSMDLFWNFIKYFDKLVIAIFSKLFKNMGDLWKYMFFAIIPFFHVWTFVTKTITLCLFISSNYAWLHPGINCFQGFTTLPRWIYMFLDFFDFFLFFYKKNKKFLKNSYILYLQALIISIGPNLVYSCSLWCYKQTIYWFVNFKIFSDFSQKDSWNLCHLINVVLNFPIYGLMIIDWNNLTDLVFDQTFLKIYISLNNSLMQGS